MNVKTATKSPDGSVQLTLTETSYNSLKINDQPGAGMRFVVQTNSTSVAKYDLSGDWMGTSTTTNDEFDEYNNLIHSTFIMTDDFGEYSTIEKNTYNNDPDAWLLGLIIETTTTKENIGKEPAASRTVVYTRDLTTGATLSEVYSPDVPAVSSSNCYTYEF